MTVIGALVVLALAALGVGFLVRRSGTSQADSSSETSAVRGAGLAHTLSEGSGRK